jgi:hypothetical protein
MRDLYAAIENGVATAAEQTATPIMETTGGAGPDPQDQLGVANKTGIAVSDGAFTSDTNPCPQPTLRS